MIFEEQANTIIVAKKRAGKTLLGWLLALKFSKFNRDIYVYRFPKPELLKKLPFKVINITEMSQINNLKNAVLLIDEAHRVFPVGEKRVNGQFRNILSLSGQNNLCVILICHNSYFINRSLFSFIDIKCIKETNEGHWELERSYMKKLYQDILIKGKNKFYMDSDDIKGIQTYNCPGWYTKEISECYSFTNAEECEDFFGDVKCEVREESAKCEKKVRVAWNKGLPKEMQPRFGKKNSNEMKRKIGDGNKGKTISKKHREIISKNMIGNKNWLGRKHTQETKAKISKSQTGSNHNQWKGGRIRTTAGYIKIYSPKHPNKDSNCYVFEHRLVMEEKIGRYLNKGEVIHHENKTRDDNRVENLKLFENKGSHKRFHLKQDREDLKRLRFENEELKRIIGNKDAE